MEYKCIYCGISLDKHCINNANDMIHTNTEDKFCCNRCYKLITVTNRNIAAYLITNNNEFIDKAISNLEECKYYE